MKISIPRTELIPEYWTNVNIITLKANILRLDMDLRHCWVMMKDTELSKNHSELPGP